MATNQRNLRTCPNGHNYYKSSECPTCPICAAAKKPKEGFLSQFSAPARRALEGIGVKTVKQLAKHSQAEIMQLHGMGPASLPKLKKALEEEGLAFRKK
jgi:predicted RecB family nuclease